MSNDYAYLNPENGLTYTYGGDGTVNCTVSVCPIELSVYGYRPSLPFSSALIALYGLCMVVQLYLGIRYKKWGFMTAMLLGCICEIIGYIGRILYWSNPWGDSGFIIQIVLITFSPVFFAAAIYVLIYQIACYVDRSASRVNPKFFYWLFIPADVISLILQAAGGALSSTSNGSSDAGVNIALAGLSFQLITLTFFAICVCDYMYRSRATWRSVKVPGRFINFCVWLALATVFILVRCAYRVYELSEGYSRDSEALRDEPLFIALEGVMIILAAWCLVPAHPGFVFSEGATLTKDTTFVEDKGAQASDSRESMA
ncbi:uncharacterized protein HMPREF1541_09699 [Cyphellophora europaea CBS 101466]|uniref:Parasitic phase-specific protein PSP-1 n=1 Tax=Cyphellophora europaea (strain CBS 101466) TaxID=1220924 RepID=W2SA91_CYPE1|nr:uncharacterized protein HMPREF1541_09699 [Cyphellophora europaea CBS 101466]ETN44824.1 hypothetical protein HMPREF1541_09699 [Cyphellophora europaea CBS 101466]